MLPDHVERFIAASNGPRIVSMTTKTKAALKRNDVFPAGVERIVTRHGILGCDYEACVNNQRQREGLVPDFIAEHLWNGAGVRVNRFLVQHRTKGNLYVVFLPIGNGTDVYVNLDTNNAVPYEEVEPFLKDRTPNRRQGTEQEVHWRTVEVNNIVEIKCGTTYP